MVLPPGPVLPGRDYLWRADEGKDGEGRRTSLDDVPVDALPLPDATPPGPPPAVPELGDWLQPSKPFDQYDMGMLLGGHPNAVGVCWTRNPETGQMEQRTIMRGEPSPWPFAFA